MRYVAIDLGEKRTGLAVGDDETGLVTPLQVIEASMEERGGASLLAAIVRAVDEQVSSEGELVIGLPLNMDGSEGSPAKRIREFASRLREAARRTIHFQDERLTSADADWSMAKSGMTRDQKKRKRDALAAAAILRDYLDARRPRRSDNS